MLIDNDVRGLVRSRGNLVEHYDGQEIWNPNWSGAGQACMDISGMGGGWHLYFEISIEEVEDVRRVVDEKYKKWEVFAYKKIDPNSPNL